jgi:HEAT repeats
MSTFVTWQRKWRRDCSRQFIVPPGVRHLGIGVCIALAGAVAAGQDQPAPRTDGGRSGSNQSRPATVTRAQVRAVLDPDEPDYPRAARLGPNALPYLAELVTGPDTGLAAKAVYAASLIRDRRSSAVVRSGSASRHPEVRVAAASAAGNLTGSGGIDILNDLLIDSDSGVRETALKSIKPVINGPAPPSSAVVRVRNMAARDPQPHIRDLARETLLNVEK